MAGAVLAQAIDLGKTNSFYIANGDFAARNATFLRDAIAGSPADVANWAEASRDLVAKSLADGDRHRACDPGLCGEALGLARSARSSDGIIVTQQAVADRFSSSGSFQSASPAIRN